MLVDRPRDDGIFAGQQGVFAPHDPLEFGEFADHLRVQVRLGQNGRPVDRVLQFRPDPPGNESGQFPEAHDLFVGGPQQGVKDHFLQVLDAAVQGNLSVLLKEELRVGQTRTDDLFVAARDHRRIPGQGVVDRQEMGQQVPRLVDHGKVLLVGHHGGDQHLLGELQIVAVIASADHRRVLRQVCHRLEQVVVVQDPAGHLLGGLPGFFENDPPPLLGIGDDEVLSRLGQVILQAPDRRVAGAHEAVAERPVAACDVLDSKGNGLAAVDCDHPVNRPGKAQFKGGPAHGFPEGNGRNEMHEKLGKEVSRLPAGDFLSDAEIFPFFRDDRLQVGKFNPLSPGKADGGPGGVSVFIDGDLPGRSELFDDLVVLPLGDIRNPEAKPPRRGHGSDVTVPDPPACEFPADHVRHVFLDARQKGGGNLFGPDFKQQFLTHSKAPFCRFDLRLRPESPAKPLFRGLCETLLPRYFFSSGKPISSLCLRYPSALSRARFRTRPM